MKVKKISILFVIIGLLILSTVSINVKADDPAKIFGEVLIDGNPAINIEVKIENRDLNYVISVLTDGNGDYEGIIGVRNHNIIRVTAIINESLSKFVEFARSSEIHEYEVNFYFGESNGNGNGNGIKDNQVIINMVTFFGSLWDWLLNLTLLEFIYCLLVLLLIIVIIKLLFPRRRKTTQGQDNDTIILLPQGMNTRVKRL